MRAIIYDPQQSNMDRMFCEHGEIADENNLWHAIQGYFRDSGFELFTPATYTGRLEDVAWVIFQNMPSDFKPLNLRRRVKRFLKSFGKNKTFYQKCVAAGISHKLAVILYEPEVVSAFSYDKKNHAYFSVVFTWDTQLVSLGNPYKDFLYPQPTPPTLEGIVPFRDRKLICNFSANKKSSHANELYSKRVETIRFFEENCSDDFDHYGRGWSPDFKSWRGSVENKSATMAGYRFNLCYENAINFRGYITEKIFDALLAGCVPVYLGAPDIETRIPKDAFIDRRQFNSDAELLDFMKSVDEGEWQRFVDAGQDFLRSAAYRKYMPEGTFDLLKKGLSLDKKTIPEADVSRNTG